MRIRVLLYALVVMLGLPLAAQAQRGGPQGEWELLGEQNVGFKVDNDSIVLRQNEDWYRNRACRSLRFGVEGNAVHMMSIRLVYINGYSEDINIDRTIRRGQSLNVDLPGERSYLKQIDMRYRANPSISFGPGGLKIGQATVKVFGERVRRRPEPVPAPRLSEGWSLIDTAQPGRRDDEVVLVTERGERRLSQIRIRSIGEPVRVRGITVRYRSGDTQTVPFNGRLGRGEETPTFDLDGRQPIVESVSVEVESRRGTGGVELQLLGARRPPEVERPAADVFLSRGWQLLGKHTVGPSVDRDVIDIKQSEDWYRNRAFRTLHFIADRADVHLMSVRVVYLNGYEENFRVDRLMEVGRDVTLDLRGDRSFLRSIELTYRAVGGGRRGEAVVTVYGEPAPRR